jgi:hypothetical protein
MKQYLQVTIFLLLTLSYWTTIAQTTNYRLKIEEGYVKQSNVFVKTDSSYYNYPNPSAGDVWGNDFSEMYNFGRDSANQSFMDNGYKAVFAYDNDMRELSRTYYYWQNSAWVLDYKWDYAYNNLGQLTVIKRYGLVSGNLTEDYRITQTFNASGYSIQRIEQKVSGGTPTNDFNKLYTRDALGNLTDYVYQKWVNNTWLNTNRTITSYKPATNLADTITRFDWTNNAWRSLTRDINEYNSSDLQTQKVTQTFNLNTQVFGNYRRETKSYNANDKLAVFGFYAWLNNTWFIDREVTYQTYTGDFFGRSTLKEYNNTTLQLENVSRTDNIFNTDGWRIRSRDYNWTNNTWEETGNRDFTFETKQTTSLDDAEADIKIGAYPNPFTSNVMIEFNVAQQGETQVEVYTITGQKVQQYKLNTPQGNNTFLWEGNDLQGDAIPAGVYLVHIQNGSSSQFTKLIKQ